MDVEAKSKCAATIEAVIIRADGTREDLGIIAKNENISILGKIKNIFTKGAVKDG